MNKAKRLIVAAGALAVLILAGCDFLKNPDYVESLTLPPELPYAKIVSTSDATGYNAYTFVLEWKRTPGLLPYVSKDLGDDVRILLEDVLNEWQEYALLIDPKPFYDLDKNGKATGPTESTESTDLTGSSVYDVFRREVRLEDSVVRLDNTNPDGNGNIVIHRYWPKLEDVSEGTPVVADVAVWYDAVAIRAEAFKQAAAKIEGMIADIKASPLYAQETFTVTSDGEASMELPNPLRFLSTLMEESIAYNPPLEQCVQRDRFDTTSNGTGMESVVINTNLGMTGPLYEYYLGYVPWLEDYADDSTSAEFAFPGTTKKPPQR